ncbi:protein FAM133-like [Penaeus monodon]|uniref:protein FAM133-like n=1 Tax=Penaeus monodon TaxID=6687 RepID=UPI0018A77A02|nr:protein FAM133-like [Penaeus monodon]
MDTKGKNTVQNGKFQGKDVHLLQLVKEQKGKKKKRKKSKDKDPSENDGMDETVSSIPEEEAEGTHKTKKKKKHDKGRQNEECPPVAEIITDIQVKKKHKKSKYVQRDPEEEPNFYEKENMQAEVNAKVQSSEDEKKTKKKKKKKHHRELSEDQELSNREESSIHSGPGPAAWGLYRHPSNCAKPLMPKYQHPLPFFMIL